jgi:hypothetical protein
MEEGEFSKFSKLEGSAHKSIGPQTGHGGWLWPNTVLRAGVLERAWKEK